MRLGKSSQALRAARIATGLYSVKTMFSTQQCFEAWPLLGRENEVGLEDLTG
jgi:hypothetical protein